MQFCSFKYELNIIPILRMLLFFRGELEELLKIVKPRCFMPIHGEYYHMVQHGSIAQDLGIRKVNVMQNGQMLALHDTNSFSTPRDDARIKDDKSHNTD